MINEPEYCPNAILLECTKRQLMTPSPSKAIAKIGSNLLNPMIIITSYT